MKIKITHLRKNCIGCNSCVEYSPENWDISDKDGWPLKWTVSAYVQKKKIRRSNLF